MDWDLAVTTAATVGGGGPRISPEEAADVVGRLRALTDEAEQHVTAYTLMVPAVPHPPVRVCDRRDWAAANVAGLRVVIAPAMAAIAERRGDSAGPRLSDTEAGRRLAAAGRVVGAGASAVQVGTVLGYLSGKVLGQYEVLGSDPGQLLLVAPNVVEVERSIGADPRDFRLWVCLHEVTHRTQFTAVPWLRGYFLDQVTAFVDAAELDADALAERLRRAATLAVEAVRGEGGSSLVDLVQTPAQRAVMERLTALLTLLEGHAEFVMDGVGPEVVPSVAAIRRSFDARRATASPVGRLLRRLLGVDTKLRQYTEGKRFVTAVVGRVGVAGLNRAWESAETLPRAAELTDPEAWVRRVHGAGPAATVTAAVTA